MQLMTWNMSRLGSRFSLLFEPYRRRVMHSAMGRFLDQPLDLMVGLVEPDGTRRVLPFTTEGVELVNCEQFERFNSITYRGYSEKYRLRFEFNLHSVFYPQDELLCVMPAFYLEMRVNPVDRVRWTEPIGETPDKVKLFIAVSRPNTEIEAHTDGDSRIELSYRNSLKPLTDHAHATHRLGMQEGEVQVHERIVSLTPGCEAIGVSEAGGAGLQREIDVSASGSGIKWRLIWGAHVADPVLKIGRPDAPSNATFRYLAHWSSVDEVIEEARRTRDDRLAHSRRFEKLMEQAPIRGAKQHLLNQGFQAFLGNTWWCDVREDDGGTRQWFSVWEGSCFFHSTIDVEYNACLWYLCLWPRLLEMQLHQWTDHENAHPRSGGAFLSHDMGDGPFATGQAYPHAMPVEENCNYLLMLQAFSHLTGNRALANRYADLIDRLAVYLQWTDRDGSGFPSEGVANTIDDASPAVQFSNKQTYLAVKRIAALRAAATLLRIAGRADRASEFEHRAEDDLRKIEHHAWLGDHYAVCIDKSAVGVLDAWTGKPLPYENLPGWDAYSIYTGNGELLPMLIGQPPLLDRPRLRTDLLNAYRECLSRYGCGHTSEEPENVWISQNLWRDHLARYLGMPTVPSQNYWDMQVMSNTGAQSLGFVDTYINNYLCFYPRGIAAIGWYLAGPRLEIDRLAPGAAGAYITVDPDRSTPQRWPLLPLADWKAGKIPICVVDPDGQVTIECKIDPVIIHSDNPEEDLVKSGGLIG